MLTKQALHFAGISALYEKNASGVIFESVSKISTHRACYDEDIVEGQTWLVAFGVIFHSLSTICVMIDLFSFHVLPCLLMQPSQRVSGFHVFEHSCYVVPCRHLNL